MGLEEACRKVAQAVDDEGSGGMTGTSRRGGASGAHHAKVTSSESHVGALSERPPIAGPPHKLTAQIETARGGMSEGCSGGR